LIQPYGYFVLRWTGWEPTERGWDALNENFNSPVRAEPRCYGK